MKRSDYRMDPSGFNLYIVDVGAFAWVNPNSPCGPTNRNTEIREESVILK